MITNNIDLVVNALKQGDCVGLPTETVYGLGANAFDKKAVEKIFSIKGRPKKNPLILHTHSMDEIKKMVKKISPLAKTLANFYWPGPLTILFDKSELVSDIITAGSSKVAIRIPNHPLFLEVLKSVDFPIAAPSANPYQRISPTSAQQVEEYFGDQLPYILEGGKADCGLESTIVGIETTPSSFTDKVVSPLNPLKKFTPMLK